MSNTEKKLDVICLGAAVVDIPLRPVSRDIFDIESYPVDRIAMSVGGDAMNEATIISRLGFKTGIIACIGDDAAGQFILRSCEKDNIDVEGIKIDPTIDTSMNIGLVTDDGERTFVTNRNGSLWKENIEHVDFEKMKQAKILSLASIFNCPLLDGKTLVKIFKEAKAAGMTLCTEFHHHTFTDEALAVKELLEAVDLPSLKTYWQPNQYRTAEENLLTAQILAPFTENVHVFAWHRENRFPLSHDKAYWSKYFSELKAAHFALLEFMPDDNIKSLAAESEALRELIR